MQIDIEPSLSVALPDTYRSRFVRRVFAALDKNCLFVGGCVRDILMDQKTADIDIATPYTPADVISKLQSASINVVETGIEHGTVTAHSGQNHIEITTLRNDVSTDGRRATVSFTESWYEDAQRRDFTINSLLMDLKGRVYDPTEQGLEDIEQKRLRFIGGAQERIQEDYLRILRYFRFAARYNLDLDDKLLATFQSNIDGMKNVSSERITQEIFKILEADSPKTALCALQSFPMFSWLGRNTEHIDKFCRLQKEYNCEDSLARLYFVSRSSVEEYRQYLRLSNAQYKRLFDLSKLIKDYPHYSTNYILYKSNHNILYQAMLYMYCLDMLGVYSLNYILEEIKLWKPRVFPLSGRDLIGEGYEAGAHIGGALDHIEHWWVDNNFQPNHKECLFEAITWLNKNR